jgi:hypothetical protein
MFAGRWFITHGLIVLIVYVERMGESSSTR